MKMTLGLLLLAGGATAGCATAAPAPPTATVAHVDETRVCVDGARPDAGQALRFERRGHAYVAPKNINRTWYEQTVATARVVRVLDDRCVIVQAPAYARIEAGDALELAQR